MCQRLQLRFAPSLKLQKTPTPCCCEETCVHPEKAAHKPVVLSVKYCKHPISSPSQKPEDEVIEIPFAWWADIEGELKRIHKQRWQHRLAGRRIRRHGKKLNTPKWRKLQPCVRQCLLAFAETSLRCLENEYGDALLFIIDSYMRPTLEKQQKTQPMDLLQLFQKHMDKAVSYVLDDRIVRPFFRLGRQPEAFHAFFRPKQDIFGLIELLRLPTSASLTSQTAGVGSGSSTPREVAPQTDEAGCIPVDKQEITKVTKGEANTASKALFKPQEQGFDIPAAIEDSTSQITALDTGLFNLSGQHQYLTIYSGSVQGDGVSYNQPSTAQGIFPCHCGCLAMQTPRLINTRSTTVPEVYDGNGDGGSGSYTDNAQANMKEADDAVLPPPVPPAGNSIQNSGFMALDTELSGDQNFSRHGLDSLSISDSDLGLFGHLTPNPGLLEDTCSLESVSTVGMMDLGAFALSGENSVAAAGDTELFGLESTAGLNFGFFENSASGSVFTEDTNLAELGTMVDAAPEFLDLDLDPSGLFLV